MHAKLTLLVWWATIVLELTILVRAFKQKLVRQYPFFFAYLGCVLLSSASGYLVYVWKPLLYGYWYWSWEFACVIAGYSVVLEIIEKGLAEHIGARKLFRNFSLALFAAIVGFISIESMSSGHSISLRTSVEFERNLRTAEAVLLLLIVAVVAYYAIPIGKNLRGILLGYGLCVATIVINDSLRSYVGKSFQDAFSAVRSWSYLVSLLIWTAALWSYRPNPIPKRSFVDGSDYEVLVAQTREAMESVRGQFGRRPAND